MYTACVQRVHPGCTVFIIMQQNQCYEQLRNAVEAAVDRRMKSPRDFDFLANTIFEKLHQSISPSTLKRFWGYMPQYASIRTSTLDILSRFVDFKDYDAFCLSLQTDERHPDSSPDPQKKVRAWWTAGLVTLVLVVAALLLWLGGGKGNATGGQRHILRCGQLFPDSAAYLSLFGINATDSAWWDQPLPHHNGIFIWGPKYGHPQWHNEGNRDSLMPTITEYLSPVDSNADDQELTREKNRERFFVAMRFKELRITFMKNLIDTGYVFLGIYRASPTLSDSTRLVWQRVADECNLDSLDKLSSLQQF